MTRDEVILFIDAELADAPDTVKDDWRIVRGHLRRRARTSQVAIPAAEEPITARHEIPTAADHFRAANEVLKKGNE